MIKDLKYIFLFLYDAADKLEERSEYFAEKRKERMEHFRKEKDARLNEIKSRIDEVRDDKTAKVRKQVKEILSETGVATKDEITELKKLVNSLSKKVDKLLK